MTDREYLYASDLGSGVSAAATMRMGGVSAGAYCSLNVGLAAGDDAIAAQRNRELIRRDLGLNEIRWLRQQHTNSVAPHGAVDVVADAHWTSASNVGLAIQTADCLPVVLASEDGSVVAAAHAGWRGLATGILEATVAAMPTKAADLRAWIGPAIGACCYEIDAPVRHAFRDGEYGSLVTDSIFKPTRPGHWLFDLPGMAHAVLTQTGVSRIDQANRCTACESERFYSYRREGVTGRQATIVWRTGVS